MAEDKCPKCGSGNITVGAFPLSCQNCCWHFLNENPCCVCEGPSVAAAGAYGVTLYWCSEHAPKDFVNGSMEQLRKKAGPEKVRETYAKFSKGGGW